MRRRATTAAVPLQRPATAAVAAMETWLSSRSRNGRLHPDWARDEGLGALYRGPGKKAHVSGLRIILDGSHLTDHT